MEPTHNQQPHGSGVSTGRELLQQARGALETAKSGLAWYQDRNPTQTDGSDDEAMVEIDATLEALREALARPVDSDDHYATLVAGHIAGIVEMWVDGGINAGTDWRTALPDIIKRRLGRFARPAPGTQAPQPAERKPVSDAMVDAYLIAQRRAVEDADRFGRPNIGGLHSDTVKAACRAGLEAALAATPQPASHVGGSSFEGWYSAYSPANKGDKQRARDAYAAGMRDPLVTALAPTTQAPPAAQPQRPPSADLGQCDASSDDDVWAGDDMMGASG